jgi:hypothetical protein
MFKLRDLRLPALVAAFVLCFGATASAQPGSEDDPLVTKGYVDARVAELRALIDAGAGSPAMGYEEILANVIAHIDLNYGAAFNTNQNAYEVVYCPEGSTLTGASGTHLILRTGRARVKSFGEAGLINGTTGAEIQNGQSLTVNHLVIFPTTGRGVTFTTGGYVMVKGVYNFE